MKFDRKTLIAAGLLGFVAVTTATRAIKETRYSRAVAAGDAARTQKVPVPGVAAPAPVTPPTKEVEFTPAPAPVPAVAAVPAATKPSKPARTVATAVRVAAALAVPPPPADPVSTIVVSYFHTTARCPSCLKIEDLTSLTVTNRFAVPLADKRLVWRTVNIDEPENAHFAKDYSLYTKSVVISEMKNGHEVRWKNLDQVWTLLRDQQAFELYVEKEIRAFLEPA